MQEPNVPTTVVPRPAAVFRAALAEAAARERASRVRRPDRARAIAGLTDDDLASLAQAFEELVRVTADASAMVERLHATLRTLSPGASDGEVEDA